MKIKDVLIKLSELDPDDEDTEFLYYQFLDRKIVGPWVPCVGNRGQKSLARFFIGNKIAQAYSAQYIHSENERLLELGYELTDLDRDSWFYYFFAEDQLDEE